MLSKMRSSFRRQCPRWSFNPLFWFILWLLLPKYYAINGQRVRIRQKIRILQQSGDTLDSTLLSLPAPDDSAKEEQTSRRQPRGTGGNKPTEYTSIVLRSKKSRTSKSGRKKGSKTKKSKSKGKGSRSSSSDDGPTAPTSAPTCLECDDFPFLIIRHQNMVFADPHASHLLQTRFVQRILLWGVLMLLLILTWVLVLLYLSFYNEIEKLDKTDDEIEVEALWQHEDPAQSQTGTKSNKASTPLVP